MDGRLELSSFRLTLTSATRGCGRIGRRVLLYQGNLISLVRHVTDGRSLQFSVLRTGNRWMHQLADNMHVTATSSNLLHTAI